MPLSPEKKETWTARMFLAIGGSSTPEVETWPSKSWTTASKAMTAALGEVNKQLGALKVALKKSGDAELAYIADKEIPKLLGPEPATIEKLLGQIDGLDQEAARKPLGELIKALDDLEETLGSATVAACDNNPFGVSVDLKGTLTKASGPLGRAATSALSA